MGPGRMRLTNLKIVCAGLSGTSRVLVKESCPQQLASALTDILDVNQFSARSVARDVPIFMQSSQSVKQLLILCWFGHLEMKAGPFRVHSEDIERALPLVGRYMAASTWWLRTTPTGDPVLRRFTVGSPSAPHALCSSAYTQYADEHAALHTNRAQFPRPQLPPNSLKPEAWTPIGQTQARTRHRCTDGAISLRIPPRILVPNRHAAIRGRVGADRSVDISMGVGATDAC